MAHTLSYLLHALVVLNVSLFITIDAAVPMFLVPNPDGSTAPSSVSENASIGTSILTLEGQDTDGDTLTFSIVSQTPTSPPFELESVIGLLKVPSELDAEFSTSYTFIFGVRDGSTTTNSVNYVVDIVDVNDNAPVFQAIVTASVSESASIGTNVTTVTATDADVSGNTIKYQIVSGNSPSSFRLNQSTGVITVSASLNAVTNPNYILTIQANDGTFHAARPATVNISVTAETTTGPGGVDENSKCTPLCICLIVIGTLIVCICTCIWILHCCGINVFVVCRKRCQRETAASPTRHVKPRNEYFPGKIYNANKLPIESETAPSLMPLVATRNEDFPEKGYITKKSQKRKREKRLPKESETALSPTTLVETRNEEFSRISPIIHA